MTDTTETERVDSPLSTIRSIEPPETNSKSRFGALRFREKPCSWVFCIIRPISTINIARARGGELVAKCMYPPLPAGAQEYLHGRFDLSRAPTLIPPHSPSSFFCPDRAKIEIYFWRGLCSTLLSDTIQHHRWCLWRVRLWRFRDLLTKRRCTNWCLYVVSFFSFFLREGLYAVFGEKKRKI